jgi:hypothetical protein
MPKKKPNQVKKGFIVGTDKGLEVKTNKKDRNLRLDKFKKDKKKGRKPGKWGTVYKP